MLQKLSYTALLDFGSMAVDGTFTDFRQEEIILEGEAGHSFLNPTAFIKLPHVFKN